MQPSASIPHEFERLDHINRLLRLQNAAMQLAFLISKTRGSESSRNLEPALQTIHSGAETLPRKSG
ncbi:MAG TPA: hypothetical protein VFH95_07390 [Candidatus Kapabacteria bacterium]|nr:hypothetical protein [Candidatus Kapabacteria bacterium]